MRLSYSAALAATTFAVLVFGAGAGMANDAGSRTPSTTSKSALVTTPVYESGMVTTQGRGRGVRRGGGGGVVVVPRRRNNTGRNIAIGVGAAVIGGIIASEAARANPRRSQRSSGEYGPNTCRRWNYQCSDGYRPSCIKFNTYC